MPKPELTGLSAFPLTPLAADAVDLPRFGKLVERLVESGVDSICALGSTGSYAYLSTQERAQVARAAAEHVGQVPLIIGIGALRTSDVLSNLDNAQQARASAVLLAPMTYQPLTDDDVYELFRSVDANSSVPVILYDNPGTTHFGFTTELYARIAELPRVTSIKIPPNRTATLDEERTRVSGIRRALPPDVTLGISGDPWAATGLLAGCDAWYSAIGGTLPRECLEITHAAQVGDVDQALALSTRLQPLWDLQGEFGSLRVTSVVAEELGLVSAGHLPLPLQGLRGDDRDRVVRAMARCDVTE